MNKRRLESYMKLNGDTGLKLAENIGISRQRFSCKINEKNGAEFTQTEITKIKNRYNLNPVQISEIFFDKEVS